MLTGDLVRPRLKRQGKRLEVEMITPDDRYWQRTAAELISLFQAHVGQPQREWQNALETYEGERVDYVAVRGLAKVLTDAAQFEALETPLPPAELRQQVFARGPVFKRPDLFHPYAREDVLGEVAEQNHLWPELVEASLFADLPADYRLTDVGVLWTPDSLISRYNLELARGVLYWAREMRIEIHDTYKDFWRYLKLFKLMFWAVPKPEGGYHVRLDGPISPFVRSTLRYGRQFAAFLPALFLCQQWHMVAEVRHFDAFLLYRLDDRTPLVSHFSRSGLYDSGMEADFAAEFVEKFGDERGQWNLSREDEVLLLGDTVMLPDFSFTHKQDGRRAYLEIMGFWHPEYLRRKLQKVRAASRRNLIVLVYEGVNLTEEKLQDIPGEVLYFKNKPVLKEVMEAVERVAE